MRARRASLHEDPWSQRTTTTSSSSAQDRPGCAPRRRAEQGVRRCRHAIGLNHVSVGIEFIQEVGNGPRWAAQQILKRPRQVKAGLRLVRWLQGRYGIADADVVGHATANDHPRFRDLKSWRNDHADWQEPEVAAFRRRL